MIISGTDLGPDAGLRCDLVVVGAGPAGIVCALEAGRRGVDVVLVETGNRRPRAEYQKLSMAELGDENLHAPVELAVSRQLGGTSAIWGGRCVPFDPVDFAQRDIAPDSRWPVTYDELQPYFGKACDWMQCGRPVFDVRELDHLPRSLISGLEDGDVSTSSLERWSLPTDFGKVYWEEIRGAPNVRVIMDATCVRVDVDDRSLATGVRCRTLSGGAFTVAADDVVVAAGGLESTRLLMCSPGPDGTSIGDHAGHLGHWYMAHVEGVIADLVLTTPPEDTIYNYERDVDGSYVRRRFTFSERFLLEHRLPNISGWIANPELSDAAHRNAMLSLTYLLLISPVGFVFAPTAQRLALTGTRIPGTPYGTAPRSSVWAHIGNVMRKPGDALRFVFEFGIGRVFSRGRKPPGFFVSSSSNRYPFEYHAEHLPHHGSRVALAFQVDELRVPRLHIDLQFTDDDVQGVLAAHRCWDEYLRAAGVGRLEYLSDDLEAAVRSRNGGGFHQVGTTRMSRDPEGGVVDKNLAVHGVPNVHVVSSSVFVTSGQANSTFMIIAFAVRLVEQLYGRRPMMGSGVSRAADHPASRTSRQKAAAGADQARPAGALREIRRAELRAPARVVDIDVCRDYGDQAVDVAGYATAWCLVRQDGVPAAIRFLDVGHEHSLALAALRDHFAPNGLPRLQHPPVPAGLDLTVVICSRDRRESLLRTLDSLVRQSDPDFQALIVDNSRDGEVARTLKDFDGLSIGSCHEPVPGLSRARNRGLAEVRTELVAYIDDDEVLDPDWIAWIKRGFGSPERPDAVSGLILPAELDTDAQVDFERYGGHNKGRGLEPVALRAGTPAVLDPLYPLPNFGAGGNMAFRAAALRAVGGFDNRLGAGTLVHGGEETRALSLLLEHGATILYWPQAVAWHPHHRTGEALEKQFYGYTAGLTAFYMSLILTSPTYLRRILRLLPHGSRQLLAHRPGQEGGPPSDFPDHYLRAGRRGLVKGAWLYLKEVRRQRRAQRAG